MHELRTSIQDLDKAVSKVNVHIHKLEVKVQNMEEKFRNDIETLKNNQTEITLSSPSCLLSWCFITTESKLDNVYLRPPGFKSFTE